MGTYEKKIKEWEYLIKHDLENSKKHENEMHDYMVKCLPFILKYSGMGPTGGSINKNATTSNDNVFNATYTKGIQRREIYYEYLRDVEGYKGCFPKDEVKQNKKKKLKSEHFNNSLILECKKCDSKNVYYDGVCGENICTDCGCVESVLGDELTYKEEQEQQEKMVVQCGYKKENHLNEWILQFQGRETTNIPTEVIEQLQAEFKKQKVKKVTEITREKVRQLLKKLKLAKYYEHSTHITHILNGLKPPEMSMALEERLRLMFKEIQDPFHKHCPRERNNFLSYSYVLYKFCELLEEDEYLPFFPLLKSKEKLHQQDVIWQKICNELQWEYIPTI